MKSNRLISTVIISILCLIGFSGSLAQDSVVQEVVRLVNQARNAADIPSLLYNEALTEAAQRHSNDMAANDNLSHTGSDGSEFWQRMEDAGYILTNGGENVLYRFDTVAASVYGQWRDSPPHQANMMNPDFVEIGLAYTQSADGAYYFTMVLGTRADVPPPPIPEATATPIPVTSAPTFTPFVPVSASQNNPTPIPVQSSPAPQATAIPTTIPVQPSATNTTLPPPPPTRIPATSVAAPVTNTPAATSTRAVASTATPPLPPDIRLIYTRDRLTLINISGRELDLEHVVFSSNSGELPVSAWSQYMQQPLFRFPAGDCMQVMVSTTDGTPRTPADCGTMKGWIVVFNDSEDFWRDTSVFTILNNANRVAVCDAMAGQCELSLSASVDSTNTSSEDTPETTTAENPDLRLFYDSERFTLLNVSGGVLNLEGLEFASRSGSLDAFQWTQYISQSIADFPAAYCLQVIIERGEPVNPPGCDRMRGWFVLFNASRMFWRDADVFSVNYRDRRIAVCEVAAGECDISLSNDFGAASTVQENTDTQSTENTNNDALQTTSNTGSSDIRLLVSQESFTLLNTSGRNLNLSNLAFESDTGTLFASAWDIPQLSQELTAFPTDDCLQVWGLGEENLPPPAVCDTRHAWILVGTVRQFWRNPGSFDVLNNQQVIATCRTDILICDFDLP